MKLNDFVKQVSLEDFGWEFKHQAYWNKRLKTTGGRFFPKDGHLDFNPRILQVHGPEIFRKIVRHELVHYHLYFQGRGYRHQDPEFKALLKQVDGLRYAPALPYQGKVHTYVCLSCGKHYTRKRSLDLKGYRCGVCQGKLKEETSI